MSESVLKEKSFLYAIKIVRLYQLLKETQREFVLSKQLLRSGTSVGAMVREAKNSESSPDFQHKLGIAQKECDEIAMRKCPRRPKMIMWLFHLAI